MSALPAVLDKLVEVFTAAVDVPVYDGAPSTAENKRSYVAVAWNGAPDDLFGDFATIDSEWLYIGTTDKLETGTVVCAAVAWSGDKDPKPRRTAALEMYEACDDALRTAFDTDPVLQALVRESISVSGASLSTGQTDSGNLTRAVFTVTYQAQI